MKLRNTKQAIYIIVLVSIIIIINYILGTQRVVDAHRELFRGGECGLGLLEDSNICSKYYGFDIYYLLISVYIVSFLIGVWYVVSNSSLLTSIISVLAGSILFIYIIEIVVLLLKVPVLYTQFMEGRQSISYSFLLGRLDNGFLELVLFLLLSITVSGMVGNILGYPILLSLKKYRRKVN